MKTKDKEQRRVMILLGAIVFLLVVIIFSSIFYIRSTRPMRQARNEAIEIAQKYTDLKEVDQFYWFNRQSSSFSLIGKDDKENKIVVIIPKSGEKVSVFNQSDGLTEEAARQQIADKHPEETIQKATLGLYKDQAAWEIMTKDAAGELHYYLLSFKDGKEINAINNI
ncbi:DUF5590 domain-containing protein [Enterococcus sp.]|uniref:cell wall elongation regulator TseB-like domain-containing protein n=1 Tax=Enterococcus sp. TaxID=35783 RepID=UPI0025BB1B63|nr:DUF5590 domain-containing protein [Enterococcus sp.]